MKKKEKVSNTYSGLGTGLAGRVDPDVLGHDLALLVQLHVLVELPRGQYVRSRVGFAGVRTVSVLEVKAYRLDYRNVSNSVFQILYSKTRRMPSVAPILRAWPCLLTYHGCGCVCMGFLQTESNKEKGYLPRRVSRSRKMYEGDNNQSREEKIWGWRAGGWRVLSCWL